MTGRVGDADRVLSPSATEPVPVSAHPGNAPSRICGEYVDQSGRSWFCLQGYHKDRPDMIVCREVRGNGHDTACGTATFAAWGWKSVRDSDEQPKAEDPKGLSGEAMPARAEGIAQAPVATPQPEGDRS